MSSSSFPNNSYDFPNTANNTFTQMNDNARLWLGGLPSFIEKQDLQSYFESFGRIINIAIFNPESKKPYAFITYEDCSSLERVLAKGAKHCVCGYWIDVKKAAPRKSNAQNHHHHHNPNKMFHQHNNSKQQLSESLNEIAHPRAYYNLHQPSQFDVHQYYQQQQQQHQQHAYPLQYSHYYQPQQIIPPNQANINQALLSLQQLSSYFTPSSTSSTNQPLLDSNQFSSALQNIQKYLPANNNTN